MEDAESLWQKRTERLRQGIKTLKEKENYEDAVTSTNKFCLFTNELSNKTDITGG